jgi:plasmid stability protein
MDKSVSPVKENIAVRGMPEGSKAKLLELAKASGRTFEAEARHAIKNHLAFNLASDQKSQPEVKHVSVEVHEAAGHVQDVSAKLDSVKRKLAGGSQAVTRSDLQRLETDLVSARLRLGDKDPSHPLALQPASRH